MFLFIFILILYLWHIVLYLHVTFLPTWSYNKINNHKDIFVSLFYSLIRISNVSLVMFFSPTCLWPEVCTVAGILWGANKKSQAWMGCFYFHVDVKEWSDAAWRLNDQLSSLVTAWEKETRRFNLLENIANKNSTCVRGMCLENKRTRTHMPCWFISFFMLSVIVSYRIASHCIVSCRILVGFFFSFFKNNLWHIGYKI